MKVVHFLAEVKMVIDTVLVPPHEYWWRVLKDGKGIGAVVYIRFPVSVYDPVGRKSYISHRLIRGHTVSMTKNRFGAIVAMVCVHAKCRLYPESTLSADRIIAIDLGLIVGIDRDGAMVTPEPL
jgi:hypothetical protein